MEDEKVTMASETFERLDHLCQLQDDWDGYGGKKVSNYVLDNLRNVLLVSDDEDWKYWMISPAPNGSLSLQSKRHTASINVGDKEFSYYCSTDNGEEGENHLVFTPSSFLSLMRRIV